MLDIHHYELSADVMAGRRTPSLFFAVIFFTASVASGSTQAQVTGTIRPSVTATQEVLKPETRVPAPVYRSVFEQLPRGVETEVFDWRESNAQVGQYPRGHADLLKWEQRNPAGLPQRPQGARP